MTPARPYALSPRDLADLLCMRGLRLTRELARQRTLLRAAGKPGPCVPEPVRGALPVAAPLPFKVSRG